MATPGRCGCPAGVCSSTPPGCHRGGGGRLGAQHAPPEAPGAVPPLVAVSAYRLPDKVREARTRDGGMTAPGPLQLGVEDGGRAAPPVQGTGDVQNRPLLVPF